MRIEFRMEGGVAHFPGINRPFTLETDELPAEEAAEVERLVERVLGLPDSFVGPSPGAADYRQYTVTIDAGGRRHVIRATDPVEQPDVQALIAFLRAKATTH